MRRQVLLSYNIFLFFLSKICLSWLKLFLFNESNIKFKCKQTKQKYKRGKPKQAKRSVIGIAYNDSQDSWKKILVLQGFLEAKLFTNNAQGIGQPGGCAPTSQGWPTV